MELAVGMEMPGFLLLSTICRQQVAQLIAALHHQFLAGYKPLHRHHAAAAGASLHLHHGKGTFLDFEEHHIINTHLHQSRIGDIHIALCTAIGVHIKAAKLAGSSIGRKRLRREENLAGLLFRIHLLCHTPGTLHHLLGTAIQARSADAREIGHVITVQRTFNLHTAQIAHGDYRCALLAPAALGNANIAHDAIIFSTNHEGGHTVFRRYFGPHHQNLKGGLGHLKLALKLAFLGILEIELFLQVAAGSTGRFEALEALGDGIDFLATAGNSSLLLTNIGHQSTYLGSDYGVENLALLHTLSRLDTQGNTAGAGQRIGFLSMARHGQIAIQAMLQSQSHSRHHLNLHGGNVAGVGICRHQNRGSTAATGAVVMRATGTVLVLVPGLSGVVMRAAFTVLVPGRFGAVVVSATFTMHMLGLSFSGVIMCAAFAMDMPGLCFGGVVVRAAFTVHMLGRFGAVVMRAAFAMDMLSFSLGGVVMRAAFAVDVPGLSFSGMVMRAAFAVYMLSFSLGGVVMRATFTVHMLGLSFCSMVMRATFTVDVPGLSFCSEVMSATFAVDVLPGRFDGMIMCASLTMDMLVGRFLCVSRRIRQSGNKA